MFQDVLTELRQLAGHLPPSVLIVGKVTPEQRAVVLEELCAWCQRDVYHPQRMAFELPTVSTSIIVVIDRVAELSPDDQQRLLQWLEEYPDAMVLSFATKPIFSLVEQGKFSERLYYRLNVITLNVNDDPTWPLSNRYPRAVPKNSSSDPPGEARSVTR
jgi:Sigma-54 interaction domain